MPREKVKRGRRAADKASKRKRDDAPEDDVPKRLKPSTDETNDIVEGADYIPMDGDVGQEDQEGAPVGDMPFYGLLDPEEQEYFSRANEVLETNQFGDAEERRVFVDSVYKEAEGKELKIACSQSCSRLMEKLISMSDMRQIRRLFSKFIGHFLHLVQHRFASHCCETLFIHAAPGVTQKVSKSKRNHEEDEEGDEPEPDLSLAEMFMKVIEELEGNWGYLLTERFASHTIRVLLLVLAGEPVDLSLSDSIVASRKKERHGVLSTDAQEENPVAQKRSVPESFEGTLKKVMQDMVSVLDDTYLRALATHPVGNPVLQVLVYLELSHFGKSSAKDAKSIIRRLIPDDEFAEGTESTVFVRGLLYDPVGSRLLETIVRCMPGKLFKGLYKNFMRDQLRSLARNITAGYVVLRVLERLGKDDLQNAVELLVPQIPNLVERSRVIVPKTLIERCIVRGVDTAPIARVLETAYDSDPAKRLNQMLGLDGAQEDAEGQEHKPSELGPDANQKGAKLHNSLFLQTMLTAPGPLSGLVYSSLLAQSPESLVTLAKDSTTSHVIQKAIALPTSTSQFRRQFAVRFTGHLEELALDSSGSRVVDALWPATKDLFFVKERMAQELTQHEMALRDSFVGRAVWRNWALDLYKRRRGEWAAKAKGLDTGEKPKSRLELAREKFAAKAAESAKNADNA
ncbi:rRNA processing protein Nop9 [Aspergillus sclerotioniger CBS 115572]|uniref:Nucleolar protein 9 n=1 Tax=Aspergillus sclerotioniger CBS 115572 TaxID=1450535 RepID=A0A317WYW6_9EURO|nr:rRNA processing protein Nop9 [Aspergillus sclerotioniger CBS 115572]PWY91576.1 rRNA processing protein Nop9 [Aspergillus sclerotioniger CBS 115572]